MSLDGHKTEDPLATKGVSEKKEAKGKSTGK